MARPDQKPPIGQPPTLEWVSVDDLSVDHSYQRSTGSERSQRLISSMAMRWNWRLCQPLAVSRRDDGSLLIVDGQHRHEAATRRGDIPHLPCVISRAASVAEEAAMFVDLNSKRQKLSAGDIFLAALRSDDAVAHHTFELITRARLSLAPHSNYTAWKPGQIFCATSIMAAIKQYGDTVVSSALVAISEAYAGKVLSLAGSLLKPLCMIYSRFGSDAEFDPDLFIEALGSVEQSDWFDEAPAIKAREGCTRHEAVVIAIMTEYRSNLEQARLAA